MKVGDITKICGTVYKAVPPEKDICSGCAFVNEFKPCSCNPQLDHVNCDEGHFILKEVLKNAETDDK